ncbi:MAG: hypothetical protein Q8L41_01445, partial [Anaerolineales bacterium]|nr:hypothetical protein [Anaerolineales bacterium]
VASKNPEYLEPVKHCLQAMARGGMYDVVGGGFARYSTDNLWRVPHFEDLYTDYNLFQQKPEISARKKYPHFE